MIAEPDDYTILPDSKDIIPSHVRLECETEDNRIMFVFIPIETEEREEKQ